jgi:excisionase family DNA binding protein
MDLLTVEEAAQRLKVTPYTIRKWLRQGRLRGIKVAGGQRWRIRAEDLDALIEGRWPGADKGAGDC